MNDLFNYRRRISQSVQVGSLSIGGDAPVRIQSMTTTNTNDTEASVQQAKRIIEAGGELVRLTTQGIREAENLKNINAGLRSQQLFTPIVADVHFNPKVAEVAALYAEKVRINPGNYVDPARTFKKRDYTEVEYAEELRKIEERFVPFLHICKQHHTAVRIGVNHGSLSDRIMSRYGDTPKGIVESCMEFLRIARREDFDNVVISIKASNTVVMVQSMRLLVETMAHEGMCYPLHLGVTEAGEGEDGRIKSAVGIGALLTDGIGDTIRVSLSEEPEAEIPVARRLAEHVAKYKESPITIRQTVADEFNWLNPCRRKTKAVGVVGGENVPVVVGSDDLNVADYTFLRLPYPLANEEYISQLRKRPDVVVVTIGNTPYEHRATIHRLMQAGITNPVIAAFSYHYNCQEKALLQIDAAADFSTLLIDQLVDGIWLQNTGDVPQSDVLETAFGILQAVRLRTTKTEYISCPGCGRTLYNLPETIARIKQATQDLVGLKIGIMGCIVNGPGEMADADYGYVGAGRGKISLYRQQVCVEKNIPEQEAVEKLLKLIENDRKPNA